MKPAAREWIEKAEADFRSDHDPKNASPTINGNRPRLKNDFRSLVGNQAACYPAPELPGHQRSQRPCPIDPPRTLCIRQINRRGRHPGGCRPRSGACAPFVLSPGLPSRGRFVARPERWSPSGLPKFGGCHLCPWRTTTCLACAPARRQSAVAACLVASPTPLFADVGTRARRRYLPSTRDERVRALPGSAPSRH
jgi:hypothetical protein